MKKKAQVAAGAQPLDIPRAAFASSVHATPRRAARRDPTHYDPLTRQLSPFPIFIRPLQILCGARARARTRTAHAPRCDALIPPFSSPFV